MKETYTTLQRNYKTLESRVADEESKRKKAEALLAEEEGKRRKLELMLAEARKGSDAYVDRSTPCVRALRFFLPQLMPLIARFAFPSLMHAEFRRS